MTIHSMKTKLIPCKSCGQAIAKNATKCPHCGKHFTSWAGIIFAVLVALAAAWLLTGRTFMQANDADARIEAAAVAAAEAAHDAEINAILEKGIKTPEEIRKSVEEIEFANRLQDATDKADAAERDNADAAAIRGN